MMSFEKIGNQLPPKALATSLQHRACGFNFRFCLANLFPLNVEKDGGPAIKLSIKLLEPWDFAQIDLITVSAAYCNKILRSRMPISDSAKFTYQACSIRLLSCH
ncbi:hypothetical protein SAMN04489711_1318 [Paracidovorax wautersii]|uniref:Uncharacterized protein n=1 Tax=Paracidovorax wautersii TaxID=1177982 RepID=A0A1I2HUZ6_9BURK|nr:hypothetical protein SAMN04489711_1318 [Paracidovorax wautersii]